MKLRYIVSSALAACLVLLAACGGAEVPSSPPPESPVSVSEVPPEAASPAAPAPEAGASQPPSQPEPEPPALTPAPGVEVRTLLTWEPGSRRALFPLPARDDRLLVELNVETGQWTETWLVVYDLASGEEMLSLPLAKFSGFEYRQVWDAPGWEVRVFYEASCQRFGPDGPLDPDPYTLPEALWESCQSYSGTWSWDAQPEKDLLTWTGPEGLWLAAADGSGARLVLATGDVLKQPKFAFLAEKNRNLPVEAALTFQCPRLMNGGKSIVVDFDLPGSPTGHIGLAVLDLATGRTAWYDPFANPLWGGLEYLDDTTVQAGTLQINVATGKTKEVTRHIQVDEPYFVATTGDFSRYFACTAEEGLAVFSSAGQKSETALTATGYRKLSLCHAIDARRVVCEYEIPGEAGLLLVTLPEEPASEPVPEPVLTVSPGVECKTLLTWNIEKERVIPYPLCGNLQVLRRKELASGKTFLMGIDLETGKIADFNLPITDETDVRTVLGRDGEFLLCDGVERRHLGWWDDQLWEYPKYTLPAEIQNRVTKHRLQNWKNDYYWDALPERDLLAWCDTDGVWISALDGTAAYLAIPFEAVFGMPVFADELKEIKKDFPDFETEQLFRDPRLLNDGKTLAVAAYSDQTRGFIYGYAVLDIFTADLRWYETGPFAEVEYLDDTTALLGNVVVDLSGKSERQVVARHWFEHPNGYAITADFLHYFSDFWSWPDKCSCYVTYLLNEADKGKDIYDLEKEGKVLVLLQAKNSALYRCSVLDEKRSLCLYEAKNEESLLLVTAPKV